MSGGVGPTYNDITLPKEEEEHHKQLHDETSTKTHRSDPTFTPTGASAGGFLSFRQLNSLAVVIILSASGLVCLDDLIFVLFSLIYVYFLSRVAFPPRNARQDGPLTNPSNKIFRLYVTAAGIVGIVVPICYIFEGIFEGDKSGVQAAAPHVFLLASQIFMEGVAATRGFSAPIRILVPIFYNARRILTLVEWLRNEFAMEAPGLRTVSKRRIYAGKVLAMVNMGLWSFNLFALLLPVYLPRAFKRYYGQNIKQN